MTIQVKISNNNQQKIKATVASGVIVARTLDELLDVDLTDAKDKYVIMYDAITGKYTATNPDALLSAASTTETNQPGLPSDFVDTLDVDLDDKINLDAGTW